MVHHSLAVVASSARSAVCGWPTGCQNVASNGAAHHPGEMISGASDRAQTAAEHVVMAPNGIRGAAFTFGSGLNSPRDWWRACAMTEELTGSRRSSRSTLRGSPSPLIAEYGFLSDCEVSALIAAILDRGAGWFRLGPADVTVPAGRRYLPGTMVLETSDLKIDEPRGSRRPEPTQVRQRRSRS